MKKVYLLLICLMATLAGSAQVDPHYGVGAVPVVNNRVTFEKTVSLPADVSAQRAYEKVVRWAEQRFVAPTVIKAKTMENDADAHRLVINAEEYIVFKNRWFVLDRSRINYWLEVATTDDSFTVKMTRINYWYEEERDGGQHFNAEDWITDDQCFNAKGTGFLRTTGKFRTKTIDLFDSFVNALEERM